MAQADGLRCVLAKLMAAKRSGHDGADIRQLILQGSSLLIGMRQQEFDVCSAGEAGMGQAQSHRGQVEEAGTELLGLHYQKAQCLKGIGDCRNAQQLELPAGLVNVHELAKMAPSLPPARDQHEEMLQRLAVELDERKRLVETRKDMVGTKRKLQQHAGTARLSLASVTSQLEGIVTAAEQLQGNLKLQQRPKVNKLEEELPSALHSIWRSIATYIEAWGSAAHITISKGDADMCSGTVALFATHDMSLSLSLTGSPVRLRFNFLPQPHLVTVLTQPISFGASLSQLFEGDAGDKFPDECNVLRCLASNQTSGVPPQVDGMLPARPYKWAQDLAGLGPPLSSALTQARRISLGGQSITEQLFTWMAAPA
mmetsp:Transcript_8355/g.14029  ORF Transcript_8355/g.14029 Transcript_8355/m.14029 type:complete len:369 (+) Transcript_8355:10-1116(+)